MSKGKPKQLRRDGDARRQAVLDAAIELFAELGFAGASARAITSRANANVATINYYFGDKVGLYHAALEAAHARAVIDPIPVELEPLEPEAALRSWVEHRMRAALRVRVDDRPAARLLIRAAADAHDVPGLDKLATRMTADMRAQVEALLRAVAPKATPASVSAAAGFLLLVATRFAESAPELARFGLHPPTSDAEFEPFMTTLWTFLRGGIRALLAPTQA